MDDSKSPVEYLEDGVYYFDPLLALSCLLGEDLFIYNTHWDKQNWPEDAKNVTRLCVICNDLFFSGADAEEMAHRDVELLYRMYKADNNLGTQAWCVHKRKRFPWSKGYKMFVDSVWDIPKLIVTSSDDILNELREGPTEWVV